MKKTKYTKLANDKKVQFCYVLKHGSYYRPASCGYTERLEEAGIYPKDKAIAMANFAQELQLIPIVPAEHNKILLDKVRDLLNRIID